MEEYSAVGAEVNRAIENLVPGREFGARLENLVPGNKKAWCLALNLGSLIGRHCYPIGAQCFCCFIMVSLKSEQPHPNKSGSEEIFYVIVIGGALSGAAELRDGFASGGGQVRGLDSRRDFFGRLQKDGE